MFHHELDPAQLPVVSRVVRDGLVAHVLESGARHAQAVSLVGGIWIDHDRAIDRAESAALELEQGRVTGGGHHRGVGAVLEQAVANAEAEDRELERRLGADEAAALERTGAGDVEPRLELAVLEALVADVRMREGVAHETAADPARRSPRLIADELAVDLKSFDGHPRVVPAPGADAANARAGGSAGTHDARVEGGRRHVDVHVLGVEAGFDDQRVGIGIAGQAHEAVDTGLEGGNVSAGVGPKDDVRGACGRDRDDPARHQEGEG